MLLLTTSFLGYPLPRSHRHGGFEKKMFPSTSYSFLFQIKAVAHVYSVWHVSLFRDSNLPTYKGVNHSPWIISTTPHNISGKQPKNLGILRTCGTLQVTKHNEATYHNQFLTPHPQPPNLPIVSSKLQGVNFQVSASHRQRLPPTWPS